MGQGRRRREEKWAILTLGFCWVFKKYQNDTIWHVDRIKKRVGNLGLGQKNTSILTCGPDRRGFEPPKAHRLTRLPIVHLRPLGHLSNIELRNCITKWRKM